MRPMTERKIAAYELLRLLRPALTDGFGMLAREREEQFLKALETLVGPLDATQPSGEGA